MSPLFERVSNRRADLPRQIDRFGSPRNSQMFYTQLQEHFPFGAADDADGCSPAQRALGLPLHQALQLPGHAGVERLEDLILPTHAFLVVNRHVSQGQIIVRARKVGF